MDRQKLLNYLNKLLSADTIKDYCPNGLQIEGKKNISRILTGVTANEELINQAILINADAIIVHHGYFWQRESYPIVGMKYWRISKIIKHDINLLAYHLPLDVHPIFGNNVQLAKYLNFQYSDETFDTGTIPSYGILCKTSQSLYELAHHIQERLERKPLVIESPNREKIIRKIAICTGGGQDFIEKAYNSGADAYISGETSERTTHIAKELGIHYIAAGHHATERYGIKSLGEHISHRFTLQHQFIDVNNPV